MRADHTLLERLCAALLAGAVLHARGYTASARVLIDWNTVKSGETLLTGADAFDVASLLLQLAGWGACACALGPDAFVSGTGTSGSFADGAHS